jgi:thiamine-monophosphate kinase
MDLSDGLADGVRQIAEASGVGMTIDAAALPISPAVRAWHQASGKDVLVAALSGGDDYELIFTVRPRHRGRLRAVSKNIGDLPITRIGVVTRDRQLVLKDGMSARELPAGYQHFT